MTEAVILSTHTMGYGVIRSLGILGIPTIAVYYNESDMGYLSKFVNESINFPHPEKEQDNFIDLLIKLGKRKKRPILIPANDDTLVITSKFKLELEKYFIVACADYQTVLKFINKENTYRIAEMIGIPIAKTLYSSTYNDLKLITDQIEFPYIVKPVQSHLYFDKFRRKMVIVKTNEELKKEYEKIIKNGLECVIQEYIPGDESKGFNFNSYKYSDSSLITFTSRKVRYSDGGIGIPTCVVSIPEIDEIRDYSVQLIKSISYTGYSCIEFKYDIRDGKYKLMEMNGRHNRSTLLSLKCGINFPWIEYADLVLGKKLANLEYKKGIYWIDLFKDFESIPKRLIKEKYPIQDFFKPYFSEKIFSTISLVDLRPAIKRLQDALKLIIRIIFKSIKKKASNRKAV